MHAPLMQKKLLKLFQRTYNSNDDGKDFHARLIRKRREKNL